MPHKVEIISVEHIPGGLAVTSRCCNHEPRTTTIYNLHRLSEEEISAKIVEHQQSLEDDHEGFIRAKKYKAMIEKQMKRDKVQHED